MALSLHVARANSGLGAEGLSAGLALAACVRSVEDHGFLLSLGVKVRPAQLDFDSMLGHDVACHVTTGTHSACARQAVKSGAQRGRAVPTCLPAVLPQLGCFAYVHSSDRAEDEGKAGRRTIQQ